MTVSETKRKPMRSFEPFHLTCLDHTVGPVFMNFFLSFRCRNIEECLLSINKGITSLVYRLPFLAGDVIHTTTPDGRMNVMQIEPYSTLIDESHMVSIKHHPHHVLPNTSHQINAEANPPERFASLDESYVPPVPLLPLSPGPRPVFRLQINVLTDGIVLAIGFHHSVFDATGAGRLIEILAECCRDPGSRALASTTELEEEIKLRRLVDNTGMVTAGSYRQHEAQNRKVEMSTGDSDWIPPKLAVYSFHFSAATIAQLKIACNGVLSDIRAQQHDDERPVDESREPMQEFISTNDIFTALVAIDIYKARSHQTADAQAKTSPEMVMIVNLREKLASLSSTYLGNAVSVIRGHAHPQDTLPNPAVSVSRQHQHPSICNTALLEITALALQLRQKLASIDDAHVRQYLAHLMMNQDWSHIGTLLPDTMVSSWRHLKVYRLDFGPSLGQVIEFNPQATLVDGICTIQPERAGDVDGESPGWEACVTLQSDAMESFLRDGLCSALSQGKIARYTS
jgi:fumigaclavine B O-acetyltransferase